MFKFLKEKLKDTLSKFSKKVDQEATEEEVEEIIEEADETIDHADSEKETLDEEIEESKEVIKEAIEEDKEKAIEEAAEELDEEVKEVEKDLDEADKDLEVAKEEIESAEKIEVPIKKPKPEFKAPEPEIKAPEPEVKELEPEVKEPVAKEPEVKEPEPKKSFFGRIKDKITKPKDTGIISKIQKTISTKVLSEAKFDELFWDLELVLLEHNVAVKVIDKIRSNLKERLVENRVKRGEIESIVAQTLKDTVEEILDVEQIDILKGIEGKKPYIMLFLGVNGTGKTTNLAKIASYLQKKGLKPVIAACDTFRAAAIQQLEEHATKLGIKMIKHDYGSDPAAVAFDAIEHAKAKGKDVVLIDTAGRMQSNANLMDELSKIIRVAKPDIKIFVGESITGNDCVEQAETFNSSVGVDAIVLSKTDIDDKGGAALSISYVLGRPIIFLGTGQDYDDLIPFDKNFFLENLGL